MRTTGSVLSRVLLAAGVVIAALAGPMSAPAAAGDNHSVLTAKLTGAAEVPPADPDGFGFAVVLVDPKRDIICYALSVVKVDDVTAAHIHRGAAGVNGPVVVPLVPPTDGFSRDCTATPGGLAKEIAGNPPGFYVNVHSADFPDGAVRGQLRG